MFFQILTKMMRNKNRLLGRHFETVQYLKKKTELWFLIVHEYMMQISMQNSSGKVVSGGFHGTPLGTNASKSSLVTKSVKRV